MSPESFKTLDEVIEPDSRNTSWVRIDRVTGEVCPLTLADVHGSLAALELSATVPENIQHSFLTARHLSLYTWFVYRFTMVAQLQAYATLEYALRERLGHGGMERPPTLRRLFDAAVAQGLIDETRIRDWPGHSHALRSCNPPYQPGDWIKKLPEHIGYLRNDLAHGSFTLYPDGGRSLRIVADIINQLYPDPDQVSNRDDGCYGNPG